MSKTKSDVVQEESLLSRWGLLSDVLSSREERGKADVRLQTNR